MRSFIYARLRILTVLIALITLLPYLEPFDWRFSLAAHFAWHLFLGSCLFALIYIVAKKYRWAFLTLVITTTNLIVLTAPRGVDAVETENTNTASLRILQFNLNSQNNEISRIRDWLYSIQPRPDVIMLIEVNHPMETLVTELQNSHWPTIKVTYAQDNFGLALLTSLPDSEIVDAQFGRSDIQSFVMTSNIEGTPIALVAAHPPPPVGYSLQWEANHHFDNIAIWAQHQPGHFIVTGDMNTTPWASRYADFVVDAGLQDSTSILEGTFPSWMPPALSLPIDLTLISPRLKINKREVLSGFTLNSDHRPVVTDILIPLQ